VHAGAVENLRDERIGELERGLQLVTDAELHGAAGGWALRDRERRAAGPGEERQPDPAADVRRAGNESDRGQVETVDERREPPPGGRFPKLVI
jgi:hypothetical protein